MRYHVYQFSDKIDNFEFLRPNLPKNEFLGQNFNNLSLDLEWAPPKYRVCQFSVKMDNFKFFDLNLAKLPNYVQYFGSTIVEGVAESWVETEMSWGELNGAGWSQVEVDGAGWRWVHGLVIPHYDPNRFRDVCACVRLNLCVLKILDWRISPKAVGGGTNFSGRTNNVQLSPHIISVQEDQELEQAIWYFNVFIVILWFI